MEEIQQKCFYQIICEYKQGEDEEWHHCIGVRYNGCESCSGTNQCIKDISTDIHAVQALVDKMNREKLDPVHFWDVVEDFCENENRIL